MSHDWRNLICIALGGAVGAVCRYLLSEVTYQRAGSALPWGTIAVNLTGCLLFGMAIGWMERRLGTTTHWSAFVVLIGFLGAFTTFSTFANDTRLLLADARWLAATGNVLIQNVGGVLLAIAGFAVMHRG